MYLSQTTSLVGATACHRARFPAKTCLITSLRHDRTACSSRSCSAKPPISYLKLCTQPAEFLRLQHVARRQQHACVRRPLPHPVCSAATSNVGVQAEEPRRGLLQVMLGLFKWLGFVIACIPLWISQLALLLLGATLGAKSFFQRTDRTAQTFEDPPGLRHRDLNVNGIRLHCVGSGSGSGKPLMLFLHGFPELWYSWRHQMEAFKDDFEVAAFDMRGYGDSDKPQAQSAYKLKQLVADVVGVVAALGHERVTLVVHDWGGIIGWFTAALHPQLVERLVVIGLPHPTAASDNFNLEQAKRSWYMGAFYAPWMAEVMLPAEDCKMFDRLFTATGKAGRMRRRSLPHSDIDRYKQKFSKKNGFFGPVSYYRCFLDDITKGSAFYSREFQATRVLPHLRGSAALKAGISTPTLMLYAENDNALGMPLIKGTEKYVENLELHVLPDCSHFVQQDAPEDVNRLMRQWLARA